MRSMTAIAAIMLLTASAGANAFAEQTCKPVVGHFEASLVPPGEGHCPDIAGTFCTAGRVWGGIQGNYEFVMTGSQPSVAIGGVPSILFFTGRSTVFLKSGDQMVGTDTGSIDLDPTHGGFASLITFDAGGVPGAGGQIRLRGEFDPTAGTGTTSGDYIGRICTP